MKYLIALYLLPVTAFADEVVEKLPWWEEMPLTLGEWAAVVADHTTGPVVLGVAGALEIFFRLVKSPKPLSIIHGLVGILKGVEKILELVIAGLDKIVPQNTEKPE